MNSDNSEIEELKIRKKGIEDSLHEIGDSQHVYVKQRKDLNQALKEINKSLESAKLRNKKFQELEKNYEQATGNPLRANTLFTARC